jgi:beta-N-acetylhexosaminidase
VTLVRDRKQQLPLRKEKGSKVLLLAIVPQSRKGGDGGFAKLNQMKKAFEQRGFEAHLAHNLLYETNYWQTDIHEQYDHIVVLLLRAPHQPFGPLLYWDDEAQSVWGINAIPKEKVVVVSLGSPYLVNTYFERVHACLNAYSYDPFTQEAVVRVLLGETAAKGNSPVKM